MVVVILGLDPGLAATGFGVIAGRSGAVQAVAHGVIRTAARLPPERRLGLIAEAVRELIEEHAPDWAAIEDAYVGANPRTAIAVGQARGAVLAICGIAGVPVETYGVRVIKVAVCGYGKAEKVQVAAMVRAILRMSDAPATDHATDALAVAICHAHRASYAVRGAP